jgi:glycosyltransferase involved in cell wall biosynthesis
VFPVHHGADEGIFNRAEDCSAVLKKYALGSFPYVLFLGRIERKKNILNLVRAFEAVAGKEKDVRLVLAGVPGIGYNDIAAYIQHSAYADRVREIGFVPREDIPALYGSAACFFYATLYEGFGLALIEALACGAPVIASLGGPFEEVGGSACVYADKDSPEDIAEKMNSILQNPRLRDELKQKGMARAREFTWAECAKQTLEVLKLKA